MEPDGEFQVEPTRILDKRELTLWSRIIGQVKVQWKHLSPEEATWEMEGYMQKAYPFIFQNNPEYDRETPRMVSNLKGGRM